MLLSQHIAAMAPYRQKGGWDKIHSLEYPRGPLKTSPIEEELNEGISTKVQCKGRAAESSPGWGVERDRGAGPRLKREQRSTCQSILTTRPVFFLHIPSQRASLIHVHSTPAPILSLLLCVVQSLSFTQKGFCHLVSALSLTRREHIKARLKPQEGRDQSLPLISSGMRQIDEDLRKGGGPLKDRRYRRRCARYRGGEERVGDPSFNQKNESGRCLI